MKEQLSDFNKKLQQAMGVEEKVIEEPRISLNKLAEYLSADSSRRKKIVEDAKYPESYPTGEYYAESREGVKNYFLSGYDDKIIDEVISQLKAKETTKPRAEARFTNNIDAVEAIQEASLPDFEGFKLTRFTGRAPKIIIKGVKVSVYPEIIIRGKNRDKKVVGAIIIHITKGGLSDESCSYASILLKEFIEAHVAEKDETVQFDLCYSIDVFTQKVVTCPRGTSIRRKKIEDACIEIAMWWKHL